MGEGRGIGNGGVSNPTGRTVSDQPGHEEPHAVKFLSRNLIS